MSNKTLREIRHIVKRSKIIILLLFLYVFIGIPLVGFIVCYVNEATQNLDDYYHKCLNYNYVDCFLISMSKRFFLINTFAIFFISFTMHRFY